MSEPPRTSSAADAQLLGAAHRRLHDTVSRALGTFEAMATSRDTQQRLDSDMIQSIMAQMRTFVHGDDDASLEPAVLRRLAEVHRDNGKTEAAAILFLQQIAELSHNHDYGHVTGAYGAVSEHDILEMVSAHVELCGLVKGRASLRHGDEALRLATVLAGQKPAHAEAVCGQLSAFAKRLRLLGMAGQAARMLHQVARLESAARKSEGSYGAEDLWSRGNDQVPDAPSSARRRRRAATQSQPEPEPEALSGGMGSAALLKATADMKAVLGATQQVAMLQQALAEAQARAEAAEAAAAGAEGGTAQQIARALVRLERRQDQRAKRWAFRGWSEWLLEEHCRKAEAAAEAADKVRAADPLPHTSAQPQMLLSCARPD